MELARQVGRLDAQVRRGDWGGIDGIGLHGKKLGLVGFGGIGRTVARIANGFGMKTLVWNSHVHGIDGLDITLIDDMDEVFAQSDIISCICRCSTAPQASSRLGSSTGCAPVR